MAHKDLTHIKIAEIEADLERSLKIQKDLDKLSDIQKKTKIKNNIQILYNDLLAVFPNGNSKIIFYKLDRMKIYLEKIEKLLLDKDNFNYSNISNLTPGHGLDNATKKCLQSSTYMLIQCFEELSYELGKSIYIEKNLNNVNETLNHWKSELKLFLTYLSNKPKYGDDLIKYIGQFSVADSCYKNHLKLFFRSIKNKDLKLQKRFPVLDRVPTLKNLNVVSKIIEIDYYNLVDRKVETTIDKELEKMSPGYQEMRELYYYLIDKVYLTDKDVKELFSPKSEEIIKIVDDFFYKFKRYSESNHGDNYYMDWLLKIGEFYGKFEDAYQVYKSIQNGYFRVSEKLLNNYFKYYKKNFLFDNCSDVLDQMKLKTNYKSDLPKIKNHYGYILTKIGLLIKNKQLNSVFDYDTITNFFYKDKEFGRLINEAEQIKHKNSSWRFDPTKSGVRASLGYVLRQMHIDGLIKRNNDCFTYIGHPRDNSLLQVKKYELQEIELRDLENIYSRIKNKTHVDESEIISTLKKDFVVYLQRFGLKWESLCVKISKKLFNEVLSVEENNTRLPNNKIPDIIVKDSDLRIEENKVLYASKIIDAKKSFTAITDDIINYVDYCAKLEFWILDDTILVKNKDSSKIIYTYSQDLMSHLKKINEIDLIQEIKKIKEESENLEKMFLTDFYNTIISN